jgi:MFS family permease
VFVLIVLSCLSMLDRQIMSLLVPAIRAELGLSDFQLGLLQGLAFALFYVTFGLFFGWLCDRFDRRGVVFVGVTAWSIATAACGLAGNAVQLMLARFGVGAGEASLGPASYSIVSDTFPKARLSFAMSVFGIGGHIGVGLSLVVGGLLIAAVPAAGAVVGPLGHLSAWRLVLLSAGLPGLLFALLIWTMADPPRRGRLASATASLGETLAFVRARTGFYLGHYAGFSLLGAAGFGYNVWAAVFLMRRFHLEVGRVVHVLAPVSIVGGVAGTLLAGWLADRLFTRGVKDAHLRIFMVGGLAQAVFLTLAVNSPSLPAFMACAVLASASGGYVGVAAAALQLVTPNNLRGRVSAGFQFAISLIGASVGPAVVGALTTFVFRDDQKIGWAIALNALIFSPLGVLAFWAALKPMRRAVEQAAAWQEEPA